MIVYYIQHTFSFILYMFDTFFNNNLTSPMLYMFALILIVWMFRKLVFLR